MGFPVHKECELTERQALSLLRGTRNHVRRPFSESEAENEAYLQALQKQFPTIGYQSEKSDNEAVIKDF